jgi:hypothetical protein
MQQHVVSALGSYIFSQVHALKLWNFFSSNRRADWKVQYGARVNGA